MARKSNIYALLKNVEGFVKSVPIDPGSHNFQAWKRDRTEMKRALKEIYEILRLIKFIPKAELRIPCGKIPQKQAMGLILPCWVIPQKQPLLGHANFCRVVLTKQALERLRPPAKKG